jgi:two-component system sensor histidine kinase CpxA
MRSILLTIFLWVVATIAFCVMGIWATSKITVRERHNATDARKNLIELVEEDAYRSFEEGGPERLAAYLRRLSTKLPGDRFLTDALGRDLVDHSDRSDLMHGFGFVRRPDGRMVSVTQPRNGRYRFIWVFEPWFDTHGPGPFIAVVVTIIAIMGTTLAVHIYVPLRRLRRAMNRFQRGDLRARVGTRRRDEIGAVSGEFDILAERVETLVTAERRLLQDVSHELRSPLARLDVAVDLAIKRDDRGPLLARIRRDVTRLSTLVGELLHLTRVEGDPSAGVLDEVWPEELLRTLVVDCSIEAEAKGCRLEFHARWSGTIRGDAELLRRAFENVVRNAIRHAPEGTPIEVFLSPWDEGCRVVVRDFGTGVPDECLSSIFDPFFRVDGDRNRESGGVGLGLSITRRSIELHRGQILARNADPGLAIEMALPIG